jgi:hypothetical protein
MRVLRRQVWPHQAQMVSNAVLLETMSRALSCEIHAGQRPNTALAGLSEGRIHFAVVREKRGSPGESCRGCRRTLSSEVSLRNGENAKAELKPVPRRNSLHYEGGRKPRLGRQSAKTKAARQGGANPRWLTEPPRYRVRRPLASRRD